MARFRLPLMLVCMTLAGCALFRARRSYPEALPFADMSPVNRASLEVTGFLQPDKLADRAGIYVVQPYQRGKIPVLFIHGFVSTPATWAALFEDLQSDPELRERCQLWFYYYPTGSPYLVAAADLRDRLTQLREQLDPDHTDTALDNIVAIGHSMGGLVAKLLATDGGDDFWHLVCAQPLKSLRMQPQTETELRRLFYFRRHPLVRRIVFLGTPHHGAKISATPPARLAGYFVHLPKSLTDAARDLAQQNPQVQFRFAPDRLPTSLTSLAPGDPGLELLASHPKPAGVYFHSVVGIKPPASAWTERFLIPTSSAERTDGVVTYASAHLDGVDSELQVSADHTHIQSNPRTLQEVRRILREHLQATGVPASP